MKSIAASFVGGGNYCVCASPVVRSCSVPVAKRNSQASSSTMSLRSTHSQRVPQLIRGSQLPHSTSQLSSRANSQLLSSQQLHSLSNSRFNSTSTTTPTHLNIRRKQKDDFAVLFDIDGVIMSGSHLLPGAKSALQKLINPQTGLFKVPVVFVTNSGFRMRQEKADQLNRLLETNNITENNVLMSHSPLKLFSDFHNRHCLISGQGKIKKISHALGFQKVTTVEELNQRFVYLDRIEHLRSPFPGCAKSLEEYFPPIEALILYGPPTKWETHLQLMLDVLLSNGHPSHKFAGPAPYPHLPILACNIDLVWKAEISMPRLAHGAFMHCLEELYKKFTGYDLKYTAICGKPSVLTYHHAIHCLNKLARNQLKWSSPVKHVYCIGDNLQSDICGANMYDRYVSSHPKKPRRGSRSEHNYNDIYFKTQPVRTCYSILVCTGVFSRQKDGKILSKDSIAEVNTNFFAHRDFKVDNELLQPDFVAGNADEAVDLIFSLESSGLPAEVEGGGGASEMETPHVVKSTSDDPIQTHIQQNIMYAPEAHDAAILPHTFNTNNSVSTNSDSNKVK